MRRSARRNKPRCRVRLRAGHRGAREPRSAGGDEAHDPVFAGREIERLRRAAAAVDRELRLFARARIEARRDESSGRKSRRKFPAGRGLDHMAAPGIGEGIDAGCAADRVGGGAGCNFLSDPSADLLVSLMLRNGRGFPEGRQTVPVEPSLAAESGRTGALTPARKWDNWVREPPGRLH
jgi:hypothetical protein